MRVIATWQFAGMNDPARCSPSSSSPPLRPRRRGLAVALVDLAAVAASDVAVERARRWPRQRAPARGRRATSRPGVDAVKYVVLRARRRATPRRTRTRCDAPRLSAATSWCCRRATCGSRRTCGPPTVQAAFDSERAAPARRIPWLERSASPSAWTAHRGPGRPRIRRSGDDPRGSSGTAVRSSASCCWAARRGDRGGDRAAPGPRARRRRRASRRARRRSSPLVDGLAAQIGDLDDDMQIAGERTAAAREHYDIAVLSYGEARDMLEAHGPDRRSLEAAGRCSRGPARGPPHPGRAGGPLPDPRRPGAAARGPVRVRPQARQGDDQVDDHAP